MFRIYLISSGIAIAVFLIIMFLACCKAAAKENKWRDQ